MIFDCDGVLVDSESISARVLMEMAQSIGVKFDMPNEEVIKIFSGVSLKYTLEFVEKKLGSALPEDFEKEYRKQTFEAFKNDLKPVEGIHNLLDKLTIPFCVASSGPHEKIRLNLTLTNLLDKFEGRIFSSYDINSWKPDPGIFLYAAEKMGFKPGECVVVEDSISGVIAARKGGFNVLGFANHNTSKHLEKEGARVFFSMDYLLELLG